ncbi:MAG TPA: lipid-A-disaccharide synthase N-terminal domain-containing protein [Tepidisphaeraceae bacterium]|nr:lipid-A-disaccharide synthase N-terminal domain-containing protein [Tepidisphaeraceae bacterium]
MHLNVPALLIFVGAQAHAIGWLSGFHMPFQDNYYVWKTVGYSGMLIFGSRTFVQWLYSERHKESRVPPFYWWLSVFGTVLCLAYALRLKDSVFILMYTFNMIPYVRNLMLIRKRKLTDEARGFEIVPPASSPVAHGH